MKKFIIEESEKERILNMHKNAIKRQYLTEQEQDPLYSVIVDNLGDLSRRLWDKLSEEEKNALVAAGKIRVEKRVTALTNRGKKVTYEGELKNIDSVQIKTRPGQTEQNSTVPPVPIEIPYIATYPDNTKQNPELQNFYFKDNTTEVSPEREEDFNIMVSELRSLIPQNEKIKEIRIQAGSTTSKVPTTYGRGKYNTIREGQENNITLANDRCAKIEESLKKIVAIYFPEDVDKTTIGERDLKPNNGPDYTEKERTYFFGTGELDPGKKSEYESKYGPHKGSYGSVMVITEGISKEDFQPKEDEIKVNEYYLTITFKGGNDNPPKKQRFRSKAGGGISTGGSPVIPKCAIW
jgi:hypothetical protein